MTEDTSLAATEAEPSAARYTLTLGALRKPFREQLSAQGLPFDDETVSHLDLDAEAATRLRVRGVLTPKAGERLYDAIAKRVWREVNRARSEYRDWLAALDALAAAEGCPNFSEQTGKEAWLEAYRDGQTPDEAWADEKSYAAEDHDEGGQ